MVDKTWWMLLLRTLLPLPFCYYFFPREHQCKSISWLYDHNKEKGEKTMPYYSLNSSQIDNARKRQNEIFNTFSSAPQHLCWTENWGSKLVYVKACSNLVNRREKDTHTYTHTHREREKTNRGKVLNVPTLQQSYRFSGFHPICDPLARHGSTLICAPLDHHPFS